MSVKSPIAIRSLLSIAGACLLFSWACGSEKLNLGESDPDAGGGLGSGGNGAERGGALGSGGVAGIAGSGGSGGTATGSGGAAGTTGLGGSGGTAAGSGGTGDSGTECQLLPALPTSCDPLTPPTTALANCRRDSTKIADDRYARSIIADAQGAYWIKEGDAVRMQAHGATQPVTLFEGPPLSLAGLAVDDNAVYFMQITAAGGPSAISSVKRDGSGLTTLASGLTTGMAPLFEHDRVYYASSTGHVASINKLGGDVREIAIDARTVYGQLASDATHLYWLEGDELASNLKRMAKAGGSAELLASGLARVSSPTPAGDSVLLIRSGRVVAVPKTGGCARTLVWIAGYDVGAFTVQDDQLYAESTFQSDLRYSHVSRAPISGGTAAELSVVTEASGASGIAVSAGRIYWTVDGSVQMLPP